MPQRLAVIKGTDNGDKWLYDAKQLLQAPDGNTWLTYKIYLFLFLPCSVSILCSDSYKTVLFTMETFFLFSQE